MATLAIYVSPRSSENAILGWSNPCEGKPELMVKLAAAPADGKANEALRRLLAKELALPKSSITIKHGHTSRHKLLHIQEEQSVIDERIRHFSQRRA